MKWYELKLRDEANIAAWGKAPATEKQKGKLRWFGCTWDEGITKGQASDAIRECVWRFPEKDKAYYSRPATEEQLEILRPYFKKYKDCPEDFADGEFLTYGEAKQLIEDYSLQTNERFMERFSRWLEDVIPRRGERLY